MSLCLTVCLSVCVCVCVRWQLLRSSLVNNRTQAIICDDLGMTQYVINNDLTVKERIDNEHNKVKDKADIIEGPLSLYVSHVTLQQIRCEAKMLNENDDTNELH